MCFFCSFHTYLDDDYNVGILASDIAERSLYTRSDGAEYHSRTLDPTSVWGVILFDEDDCSRSCGAENVVSKLVTLALMMIAM